MLANMFSLKLWRFSRNATSKDWSPDSKTEQQEYLHLIGVTCLSLCMVSLQVVIVLENLQISLSLMQKDRFILDLERHRLTEVSCPKQIASEILKYLSSLLFIWYPLPKQNASLRNLNFTEDSMPSTLQPSTCVCLYSGGQSSVVPNPEIGRASCRERV